MWCLKINKLYPSFSLLMIGGAERPAQARAQGRDGAHPAGRRLDHRREVSLRKRLFIVAKLNLVLLFISLTKFLNHMKLLT